MFRKGLSLVFLILLALILAACRRGGEGAQPTVTLPTTAATAPATAVAATSTVATAAPAASPTNTTTPSRPATAAPPTAAPPTATAIPPTAVPPTAVRPTATVSAGPPPGGSARIQFAPGATSAVVQSTLAAGGDTDTWVLRVMAGQVVTVQAIANPPGHIVLKLGDMAGGVLATNPDTTGISAAVPATGDYQINLSTASGAPGVGYTMQVFIPGAGGPITPRRIHFQPGQSSTQLADVLDPGGDINQYVLSLAAGQGLSVGVFADPPDATRIFIRDTAGQLIASGTDMSGVSTTTTAAGDYYIDVSSPNAAPRVVYTLTVTAPPLNPSPPTRIQFAPGQSSAQLFDRLDAGGDINRYVLQLGANQQFTVAVFASPPAVTSIFIRDTNGQNIASGTDMSGASATTTVAGDYYIDVSTTATAPVTSYTLTVTAPPLNPPPPVEPIRVNFGPGQTSASFNGQVAVGLPPVEYVIHVLGGQTLITNVNDNPRANADVTVRDVAGNVLNFGRAPTELGTQVPADGDYVIAISTMSTNAVSYSLEVIAPPLPPANATRIEFQPGATSATVTGDLAFGGDVDNWVVRALAGQTMNLVFSTEQAGWLDIVIYNDVGQLIAIGSDLIALGVPLATTGDYTIVVASDPAIGPLSYSMVVDIQ